MSGFSNVSLPTLRVEAQPASLPRAGQTRQWAIGVRMSGALIAAIIVPSEGDDAVDDRLRVNHDVEAVAADPEKVMRLNQFEALFH